MFSQPLVRTLLPGPEAPEFIESTDQEPNQDYDYHYLYEPGLEHIRSESLTSQGKLENNGTEEVLQDGNMTPNCHAIPSQKQVEGMDEWCVKNCPMGNCPKSYCHCE